MKNFVLFPFDKIKRNSAVILYAAGDIGKSFLSQIEATNYCRVVEFMDANANNINFVNEYPCVTIEKINEIEFDYIIIAKRLECSVNSIYELLIENGVEKEKIVKIEDKYLMDYYEAKRVIPENANWKAYYTKAEKHAKIQYESYLLPLFHKYLPLPKEINILDFACGEGRIANIAKSFLNK